MKSHFLKPLKGIIRRDSIKVTIGDFLLLLLQAIEDGEKIFILDILNALGINNVDEKSAMAQASKELKRLYINGITDEDHFKITNLCKVFGISASALMIGEEEINSDPVRRYFESHLAYETLKENLHEILSGDLINHLETAIGLLPISPSEKATLDNIPDRFGNVYPHKTIIIENNHDRVVSQKVSLMLEVLKTGGNENSNKELFEAFKRLKMAKGGPYGDFTFFEKFKMLQFLKIACLSNELCASNHYFGLNIGLDLYGQGLYYSKNRGRYNKERKYAKQQGAIINRKYTLSLVGSDGILCSHVTSHHLGVMKNTMPLPKSDLLFNNQVSLYSRPCDANGYFSSPWTKANFSLLIHPFCSSISGVMLAFMRVIFHLRQEARLTFYDQEKFRNMVRCLSSFFLFNSGGHCYHEFLSVLGLNEVSSNFTDLYPDNVREDYFLLENNEKAVNAALNKTYQYQHSIFMRRKLNAEINQLGESLKNEQPKQK